MKMYTRKLVWLHVALAPQPLPVLLLLPPPERRRVLLPLLLRCRRRRALPRLLQPLALAALQPLLKAGGLHVHRLLLQGAV